MLHVPSPHTHTHTQYTSEPPTPIGIDVFLFLAFARWAAGRSCWERAELPTHWIFIRPQITETTGMCSFISTAEPPARRIARQSHSPAPSPSLSLFLSLTFSLSSPHSLIFLKLRRSSPFVYRLFHGSSRSPWVTGLRVTDSQVFEPGTSAFRAAA